MTYSNQQYQILLAAGHTQPDPRKQFITDLIEQVNPRWIVQANSMIRVYQSCTEPFTLSAPNTRNQMLLSIDAFMDDTWLPAPNTQNLPLVDLASIAQQNLQKWHDILQSSGGQLNPKKCVWMLFHWKFQPSRVARIVAPPTPLSSTLQSQVLNRIPSNALNQLKLTDI